MGLTGSSTGIHAPDFREKNMSTTDARRRVVALAGNPNVGKSSIFNALTGMHQHTGNWPGKTVSNARGSFRFDGQEYDLIDVPGAYSLSARSAEEEAARDFICFGQPDAVVVVCDASCLERNLNLVLQILEITSRVIVCVNLMDEARRRQIQVHLPRLSRCLGVPVVGTCARQKETLFPLMEAMARVTAEDYHASPVKIRYPKAIEQALQMIEPMIGEKTGGKLSSRWLSLQFLQEDCSSFRQITALLGEDFLRDPELLHGISLARKQLLRCFSGVSPWQDAIVSTVVSLAEKISRETVSCASCSAHREQAPTARLLAVRRKDLLSDRILTGRITAFPIMLAALAVVFWITICGANVVSDYLGHWLFAIQDLLTLFFTRIHAPEWLHGVLVLGLYRVVAWVVSVMLPPMAIFFPLFALLEDSGFLPRIAYNLDKPFQCCRACGKQALTMCMVFGRVISDCPVEAHGFRIVRLSRHGFRIVRLSRHGFRIICPTRQDIRLYFSTSLLFNPCGLISRPFLARANRASRTSFVWQLAAAIFDRFFSPAPNPRLWRNSAIFFTV